MQVQNFKNIIFDLGGVIIDIDYHKTIRAFEKLGASSLDIKYSQKEQDSIFNLLETGDISPQAFVNRLLEYLPKSTTPNQVVAAWNTMLLGFPKQKLELLEKAAENHTVFLLSNTNVIHEECFRRHLKKVSENSLESYFEKAYLSHEIGRRKPHPSTFEFVCNDAQILPKETLFIDDSEQHIEGAEAIGLHTFLLENPEDLYAYFS